MTLIQTKICGITTVADAKVAEEAKASAIGLNFYAKSKRYVEPAQAETIIENLSSDTLATVGVFVNSPSEEVISIAKQVSLSHVQFHGDEQPEIVAEVRKTLRQVKLIRAVRIINNDFEAAQREIELWESAGVDMLLLDAASPGSFGGTGNRLDWEQLTKLSFSVPWLLAGGLTPENVAEAIQMAKPVGVDVASGVESAPGIKDSDAVRKFVDTASHSFR